MLWLCYVRNSNVSVKYVEVKYREGNVKYVEVEYREGNVVFSDGTVRHRGVT